MHRLKRRGSANGTSSSSTSDSASSGQSSSSSPGSSRRCPPAVNTPSAELQTDVMSGSLPVGASTINLVSSQTVALDVDDAAAIDELVRAYRESLHVQVMDTITSSQPASSAAASTDELAECSISHLKAHSAASNMSDLVNIAELSVRRVIAMAKQVRFHITLLHDDDVRNLM